MVTFSTELEELTPLDELRGKLASDPDEQRLMRSVLDGDKEHIDEGKLITDAVNQGLSAFTPSMLFEHLVQDYKNAEQLYGEVLLREATGYSPSYLERNLRIPEFRRELKRKLERLTHRMQDEKLLDREHNFTERALKLASLVLYAEELDRLVAKGIAGESRRTLHAAGMKGGTKPYRKERYRDISVRKTLRLAMRRGHGSVRKEDLVSMEREGRGEREIIYCLDASGSMKGEKLGQCKKAGIALAYKAIEEDDRVGLVVFGGNVKSTIAPTTNFAELLMEIVKIKASSQTNIAGTIREASLLPSANEATRHIIIISDAVPTAGKNPENDAVSAAAEAAEQKMSISVVGIQLSEKGKKVAEKLAEAGRGRIFLVRNLDELDSVVLEDYYAS